MIRIFLISIMSSVFLIGMVGVVISLMSNQNASAQVQGSCPDMYKGKKLWSHTYGQPEQVINTPPTPTYDGKWSRFVQHTPSCVVAQGTIENDPAISDEHDGDLHFLLTPDKGYENLLNTHNTKGLMVELICMDKNGIAPSYKQEFGDYCRGLDQSFPTLKYGQHVIVTGKWVQDVGHPTPGHPAHDHETKSIQRRV
jgi:hypothetical protein